LLPTRNAARWSSGMPSMSQITITGRRWARSRITSISPLSTTRSSCSSTSFGCAAACRRRGGR
jgi:hypothetical protein